MVTHEQEEKLERLVELHLGADFEFVEIHEVGSLKEINDLLVEEFTDQFFDDPPNFDDPVSEEDEAALKGLSVAGLRIRKRQASRIADFGDHYSQYGWSESPLGRISCSQSNLPPDVIVIDITKNVLRLKNGNEIEVTWEQCSDGCAGWIHSYEPYEIQECDSCGRFNSDGVVSDQELAVEAHKKECGCAWPEFDIPSAAMSWVDHLGPGANESILSLNALLETRGITFMDNIGPAIYLCSQISEQSPEGSPNRINLHGLMKLLKETRTKIENEELKLKDFGDPPGDDV